jgi:hypothetical protein
MDFSFMFASVESGFASISLFASGVLASPIFKIGVKVFSVFGHAAAISLWLSNHRKTRKAIFVALVLVGCYLIMACASPTYEKAAHSDGVVQERGLYGGDFCAALRTKQYDTIRSYKECVGGAAALLITIDSQSEDDIDEDGKCQQERAEVSIAKDNHYRCSEDYRATKYLYNPTFKFNVPEL